MMVFNYISIFILSAVIVKIALFSIKRNKYIEITGREENFLVLVIMFLSLFVIPLQTDIMLLSAIRNMLFYLSLFSTYLMKRGLSKNGFEKFFITIKWESISCVLVERYLMNRVLIKAIVNNKEYSLVFKQCKLDEILIYISKRITNIKIDSRIKII